MAVYLVPWSGGLDSTYLIHQLLSEGHCVRAISWNMNPGFMQDVRQKKAIEEMTPLLEQFRKDLHYTNNWFVMDYIPDHEMGYAFSNNDYFSLGQVPSIIAAIARRITDDTDFVAIGYVMGDDALSFLDEINALYTAFINLRASFTIAPPKLVFPLIKRSKYVLYELLPDNLKGKVTWCESHKKIKTRGCGICPSCVKMKIYYPGLFKRPDNTLQTTKDVLPK